MRFDGPVAPHTNHRLTTRLKVDYWTNKAELDGWSPHKLTQLDRKAELNYIQQLKIGCEEEISARQRLVDEATGWFLQDADKMHQARTMKLPNCDKLDSMGGARNL
jgi:DnaJ family protein B protein 12